MRPVQTYRIAVFIPREDVEQLLSAVLRVTDLKYGNYSGVTWTSAEGEERYTSMDGASPVVGSIGKQELVRVMCLEFSIPRDQQLLRRVISEAIYSAHRWEEPVISVTEAFDVRRR
jgi:hypothetical protein